MVQLNDQNLHFTDEQPLLSTGSIKTTKLKSVANKKTTGLFELKNDNGMFAGVSNYGGRLVSLRVPSSGGSIDVVPGFQTVEEYEKSTNPYYGAIIGRYCNRIAGGRFTLNDQEYFLFSNDGPNTLHGGKKGLHDVYWDVNRISGSILQLNYLSKDMEDGFPGNLRIEISYELTDDNSIKINYTATTDKVTVINLTNLACFNLNGAGSGSILHHTVKINADFYTPIDSALIPSGEILSVSSTPFDFRKGTIIGTRINDYNEQLKYAGGYDHNFVLNKHSKRTPVARVIGDKSGIVMEVYTEEPGLQFYSGNFMAGENIMRNGHLDKYRTAFILATQHFPDSPNQPAFPSTVLNAGRTYRSQTHYKFIPGK